MLLKDNILWLYNFQTRMLKQKKPVAFFVFEALFLGAIIIECASKSHRWVYNAWHFPHLLTKEPSSHGPRCEASDFQEFILRKASPNSLVYF